MKPLRHPRQSPRGRHGAASRASRLRVRLGVRLCFLLLAAKADAGGVDAMPPSPTADPPIFDESISLDEARFGAQLGAGSHWQSQLPGNTPGAGSPFAGSRRQGCSGVDLNGFLHTFNPTELLGEMRNSLLSGAQSAATNYVLTLAYASPTVASVLDMMDKRYNARYSAFAQACSAQVALRQAGEGKPAALAAAGDQCFHQEITRGSSPTEAYRRCSVMNDFEPGQIPASLPNVDFLRRFTTLDVSHDVESLLALLPDARILAGGYQFRPPQTTLAGATERLRANAKAALDRIDNGQPATKTAVCGVDVMLQAQVRPAGCLPAGAMPLVASAAFQASRSLGKPARAIFHDALAARIAVGAAYGHVLDLFQQISQVGVHADDAADAGYVEERRHLLARAAERLLIEADTQVKAEEARTAVVRAQVLALEQTQRELEATGQAAKQAARSVDFSVRGLARLFSADR